MISLKSRLLRKADQNSQHSAVTHKHSPRFHGSIEQFKPRLRCENEELNIKSIELIIETFRKRLVRL